MKIYIVGFRKSNGDDMAKTVAAESVDKAIEHAKRYWKRTWYGTPDIRSVMFDGDVDIYYKTDEAHKKTKNSKK